MSSLIIAAAGAGKTTFLVKKALEISENVLITTYTDANEQSIRDKFYEINGCIPSNVTIMPWFSSANQAWYTTLPKLSYK